jgi:hypothetical protein
VFNYSNKILLTYELGFQYTDSMLNIRLPFAAHWANLAQTYRHCGTEDLLMSRRAHV